MTEVTTTATATTETEVSTTAEMNATIDSSQLRSTEPKRVKVYVLEDNEWKDTGTGFCIGEINHELSSESKDEKDTAFLIVTDEEFPTNVLLKSKLEGNIEYQRQEETLIVWKDLLGHDIALSFEESIGCDSLCEFIVQVQKKVENNISLVAVKSNDNGVGSVHEIITGPVVLPNCEPEQDFDKLMESLKILNENTAFEFLKNETIEFVLQSHYIDILITHFHKAEKEHLIKDLFLLSNIIKSLILYNQRDILEQMVEDDRIMGIVGILEYDTEFPSSKANHRECLKSGDSNFKEVIPLENEDLKCIIKKCFRLQFLKDVVLVRFLDDHNFNLIIDVILDLETCIIDFLQVDPFLDKILALYRDPPNQLDQSQLELRKNGIKLIHQCIQVSRNLEPLDKSKFFKTLVRKGLFIALDYAFNIEADSNIRILATDMIITIIEHDILLIHNVQIENKIKPDVENEKKLSSPSLSSISPDMPLLLILSTILLTDKNPGLREQVVQALNTLLHPEGCIAGGPDMDLLDEQTSNNLDMLSDDLDDSLNTISTRKNATQENSDIGKNSEFQVLEYFNNFYREIAPILFKPLMSNAETESTHDDILLIHLVKLISFISLEHNRATSRKFILENAILKNIANLITGNHILQLKLTCIRFLKNVLCMDDKYYHRYMISNNLYDPIISLLKDNITEDNLTNSCIQDFFKIISLQCSQSERTESDDYNGLNGLNDPTNDPVLGYKRTNFTMLNKYLLGRYGELIERLQDIPFIKDMIEFNKTQLMLENAEKDDFNEKDDIAMNLTELRSNDTNINELRIGDKRLHSELDSSNSNGNLILSKSIDCNTKENDNV
ncbi:hypothetical protein NCAS_0G01610 [Naumovozyma castellii]|uniref:Serine/threonine-protein phosphatase 4 regulatory subunit 3 n=1 Tax=Naumovozyma castellii TaxID=27288 RepID=G0VI14_NAUCA|nr:hypothetical protein NCAS_0G01610 [Naumovozyma castellii CBS 4309]CCC71048.1 hypothetical protein NCAS_0G01610 [Naumovozyma castellii CBS 4309]